MNNQQRENENDILLSLMGGSLFTKKCYRKDVERYVNVDTIRAKIDELEKLMTDYDRSTNKFRQVKEQHSILMETYGELVRGEFFSSLDDVFDVDMAEFNNANVNTFNRNHFVTFHNGKDTRYETTAKGARCKSSEVIHSCSSKDASCNQLNIFGMRHDMDESAPLMPQSKQCARYWFHLVQWVLHVPHDEDWSIEDRWVYMQKCIHGFSLEDGMEIDDSDRNSVSKKPKVEQHATEADNDSLKMNSTSMNSRRRAENVGITNFASNQIHLYNRKTYFDKFHCTLIVPILDKGAVKDWNGEGYDAIVLCSKMISDGYEFRAKKVYQEINAHKGQLFFATKTECDVACELLKEMILSLCKSFKETFPIDYLYSKHEENHTILEKVCNKLSIQIDKPEMDQDVPKEQTDLELEQVVLDNNPTVPVPKSKDWTERIINVRKVKFCGTGGNQIENQSLAPDPVLLVAKAASNWLQLQDIPLLPGYNDDDDPSLFVDDYSLLGSSAGTCTYSEEARVRGWDVRAYGIAESMKKPSVDEINFVPNDALGGTLSDDEE